MPDWLSVVDRRMRVRSKAAQTWRRTPIRGSPPWPAGIVQHYHDDRWFHQTRAFAELNLQLTVAVRDLLPQDDGFRPSFLGHILVEILLDAALIAETPDQLDAYYEALHSVDSQLVGDAVNGWPTRPSRPVAVFIPAFLCRAVLVRLPEDAKLLARLNRVMRRVQLPPLPDEFLADPAGRPARRSPAAAKNCWPRREPTAVGGLS